MKRELRTLTPRQISRYKRKNILREKEEELIKENSFNSKVFNLMDSFDNITINEAKKYLRKCKICFNNNDEEVKYYLASEQVRKNKEV